MELMLYIIETQLNNDVKRNLVVADRPGPLLIDVLDNRDGLAAWLSPAGLNTSIPYHIMVTLGDNPFAQQVYPVASLGFC